MQSSWGDILVGAAGHALSGAGRQRFGSSTHAVMSDLRWHWPLQEGRGAGMTRVCESPRRAAAHCCGSAPCILMPIHVAVLHCCCSTVQVLVYILCVAESYVSIDVLSGMHGVLCCCKQCWCIMASHSSSCCSKARSGRDVPAAAPSNHACPMLQAVYGPGGQWFPVVHRIIA